MFELTVSPMPNFEVEQRRFLTSLWRRSDRTVAGGRAKSEVVCREISTARKYRVGATPWRAQARTASGGMLLFDFILGPIF
jgi:hypothetical protein